MAKYGMSKCTLGHAAEFAKYGIAVNSLWPRTIIQTAALQIIPGANAEQGRKPEIMADAAWWVLTSPAADTTGNFFVDDDVLAENGITDLDAYAVIPGNKHLQPDFFLD
jgi:citronellol/citronellal dehydrogenase